MELGTSTFGTPTRHALSKGACPLVLAIMTYPPQSALLHPSTHTTHKPTHLSPYPCAGCPIAGRRPFGVVPRTAAPIPNPPGCSVSACGLFAAACSARRRNPCSSARATSPALRQLLHVEAAAEEAGELGANCIKKQSFFFTNFFCQTSNFFNIVIVLRTR